MLLEGKFLEFHRYVSSHNLPLEAISDAYGVTAAIKYKYQFSHLKNLLRSLTVIV